MINNIVSLFRQQAKQHKAIKAFYHNRSYEIGSGKESYPLFWLEDPVHGKNQDNVFTNSVNFSILFLPDEARSVTELQNLAFSAGLNIIERIKSDKGNGIGIRPDWTYTTLREYYDDNACGCRFSVNFTQANMQNLCLIDEQFDPEGGFEKVEALPLHKGCEVFANKFPDFDLKTRK